MNINEDKIISTFDSVRSISFEDLNDRESLLVISNLLLNISEKYLPSFLKEDSTKIVSNGKRISYEMVKNPDNFGLNLSLVAHQLLSLSENEFNNDDH